MGVWIGRGTRSRVPIIVQWGSFDIDAALREVDRAYADGDLVAGEPRVLTPTSGYLADSAMVADLQRLQAHIAAAEAGAGQDMGLTAIVARDPSELPGAAVYAALWELDSARQRYFRIVKTFEEAEAALGVPALAQDLYDLTRRGPSPVT